MMWIGLVAGIVLGALIWGIEGALTLGFIGWITGLIIQSNRKAAKAASVVAPAARSGDLRLGSNAEDLEVRVARLERSVTALQMQLARMGSSPVIESAPVIPDAAPVIPDAAPVIPDAAIAATVGDPISPAEAIGSPTIAAEAASGTTMEPPPPPSPPHPILAWFYGVNAIARVGLVILFFGLAFLLKYAADNQMLPPELRVAGVAIGGIAMLILGWRLRTRKEGFALGLQGAGVAILYLTTFASFRLYHLIPPELAFFLLAGIAVFSAALAIMQDAVALAVIGAGGGFLAPVLASSGGGSHVMLFGYYLVLNLGIAVIAYYRAWRPLNLTGFIFTFAIGLAWGLKYYRPEHLDTTEPFLIAFWLVYVVIAILVAREKPSTTQRYVDGTLVFGVPLAAFALQAGLMKETEYGLSISSLVAAGVYIGLATWLIRTGRESWNLLAQSFLALGVVFVTLAIPLALDARWTSASWALEGAAIIWIGLRQDRKIARFFGILLQVAAGVAFFEGYRRLPGGYPLVDAAFIGSVLIALAGLWVHRLFLNNADKVTAFERGITTPIFYWGLLWTLFAGLDEISAHVPRQYAISASVAYLSAVAVTFGFLSRRWEWQPAAFTARALLPVLWFVGIVSLFKQAHPLGNFGWIAWPIAVAALAWILRTIEPEKRGAYTTFLHAGWMLLAALLGAAELHWQATSIMARGTAWSVAAPVIVPALLVTWASARAMDERWPVAEHAKAYRLYASFVLALAFAAWILFANATHDGSSQPLPYIPILNALDLAHLLGAFALAGAWLSLERSGIEQPKELRGAGGYAIVGALAFIWLNAILLRTLSHWASIPYDSGPMMRSQLVQASLSIFWTVIALATMIVATRKAIRPLWMVGVALLGVVVAKLFLFDLSHAGRIEQIVSFIAVGLLILVVGYFSPLPPRSDAPSPLGEGRGEGPKPETQ